MANNAGNSRMDTLLKIVLIGVMSVLSFSIGAFVGKQVSDTEHRQALLESEGGAHRGTASINPHATEEHPEEALSEDDIASLTEEFVRAEKKAMEEEGQTELLKETARNHDEHEAHSQPENEHSDAHKDGYKKLTAGKAEKDSGHKKESEHGSDHSPTAEHTPTTEQHKKSPSQEAMRVAADKAPIKDPAKVRKPTSVLPKTPTTYLGKFTVQVASYATEAEAKNHQQKLMEKGFSAFYVPAVVRGKNWYRVSVGTFNDYNSAMAFRQELITETGVKSPIVQKIVK